MEKQIRQWWNIFGNVSDKDKDVTDYIELRIFGRGKTFSGYFNNVEAVIAAAREYNDCSVYFTINPLKHAISGRAQCDRVMRATGKDVPTTSDNDVTYRRWLFIDIDPERPSGTNATDDEKAYAQQVAIKVANYLHAKGWQLPVMCDSGNGYHLFYATCLGNDKDTTKALEKWYAALDAAFSHPQAHIDVSVKNAARICKLPGTYSRKGRDTEDRPQRMDTFIIPELGGSFFPYIVTPEDIADVVADLAPETVKQQPTIHTPRAGKFDANAFVKEHLDVKDEQRDGNTTKYILRTCPFNDQHKDCSVVYVPDDGPIAFKCQHNSCQDKHWRDVRLMFEPEAYAPKQRSVICDVQEFGELWQKMRDITYVDYSDIPKIATGIDGLEDKLHGLLVGEVTVISGNNGSGKSTFINNIIVNALRLPHTGARPRVASWSAELPPTQFKNWLYQAAAGGLNDPKPDGTWGPSEEAVAKLDEFFGDDLLLRNNEYGSAAKDVLAQIDQVITEHGVNLVIIDNLMAIDLSSVAFDKWDAQGIFMGELCNLAKKRAVHIILVAHPRKSMDFLRKEHISGSADITNRADNVLIIHRINKDFETRAGAFFGEKELNDFLAGNYSAAVEVVKNRSFGSEGLVGLYFDKRKMRYSCTPGETWVLPCLLDLPGLKNKIPF